MTDDNPYKSPATPPYDVTPGQVADRIKRKTPLEVDIFTLFFRFSGRIGRRQFLTGYLFTLSIISIAAFIDIILAAYIKLLLLYPLFALSTKRYHDLGKAGWAGLFQLLPGFGWLIVLAGCGLPIGDFHDNQYGESIYRK
ncbi:DUF805 domain-containing protein [Aliikangiella coralliicola]|uniref:DUF805 domain-containing protein n=1 Tax=Aliikangiella coralliicola TaxID=2592383 RepID=A0A545UBS7_9GAMM|nr:DUF805 domain-containing protein [Aliikangiella coralliicola]TQV86907.1 DUF805 domain-containing protein [Aliikangiella coralliicola]